MRTIERFGQFKRDYKREKKGQHAKTLDDALLPIITALANDEPLGLRHRDHSGHMTLTRYSRLPFGPAIACGAPSQMADPPES